ncbi:AIR synthase-related protein, partial [Candidatus Caldatribacterium sp.]|uniref:AIR synthase-related protein n=1 Tax=Candidatus Caldatribacterium sp. TaxID=2282143 RepID=UPI00384732D5|nr:AIR synthase-related protein [Candidatus Caldatribacterium sp.]
GGIAIAVAEAALSGERLFGVDIDLAPCGNLREDVLLFGESCGRVLVSLEEEKLRLLAERAEKWGIPYVVLGKVGGESLIFRRGHWVLVECPVLRAFEVWEGAITQHV